MTQEFLQDAMVADLKELFAHERLKSSLGVEREIQIYPQDVPIRESDDEAQDKEAPPEPYAVVRLRGGKTESDDDPQIIDAVLVACVYDPDPGRQGYRDALHIINKIYHHYSACAVIGNRWEVLYPMEWTTQEEDTHPYYFTAMSLRIQAPAVHKEVPEA